MDNNPVPEISTDELKERIRKSSSLIIDVLPGLFYKKRHIQGAMHACVFEVTFSDQVKLICPNRLKSITLYGAGRGSIDAVTAARKLAGEGYRDIAVYPGGIDEWIREDLPLEGDSTAEKLIPDPYLKVENRTYRVDRKKSFVAWTGFSPSGSHNGILRFGESEILHHDGMAGGHFIIDMKSIKNIDVNDDALRAVLEAHLASEDFFKVSIFPEARFTIKKSEKLNCTSGMPNFHVAGVLEITGRSAEINFPAHVRNLENGRIGLQASVEFDRTDWGVLYGSGKFFRYLGYHLIYDTVRADIQIVMV